MAESTLVLKVEGMTCGGCEASLVRVLSQVPGVIEVRASHERREAVLRVDPDRAPTDELLNAAVDRAGFTRVG